MKIASLHVLSHTNEKDHTVDCVTCDHTITYNLTPILPFTVADYTFNEHPYIGSTIKIESYTFLTSNTPIPGQLFSRPPPLLP